VEPERLLLVVVGEVNAGKSSLVNALLRRSVAGVSPIAGYTQVVHTYEYNRWFTIVDTPGLQDVDDNVANRTLEVLPLADVILYLVNCAQGCSRTCASELATIKETGTPYKVLLSRADLLRDEEQKAQFLEATSRQLSVESSDVLFVSEQSQEGLRELAAWIEGLDARSLDWARVLRLGLPQLERMLDSEAESVIWKRATAAGVIGAVPIPIADIIPITGLQVEMAYELGKIFGEEIEAKRLKEMVAILGAAVVAREVARQLVKLIPGVGWVVSAGVAFGATVGIGKALKAFYSSGLPWNENTKDELQRLAREEAASGRQKFKENKSYQEAVRTQREGGRR